MLYEQDGDREVAAVMCVLMAGIVAVIPLCPNVYAMYVLMVIKGMCFVIKESTVSYELLYAMFSVVALCSNV
jgi:hypothetical protein